MIKEFHAPCRFFIFVSSVRQQCNFKVKLFLLDHAVITEGENAG